MNLKWYDCNSEIICLYHINGIYVYFICFAFVKFEVFRVNLCELCVITRKYSNKKGTKCKRFIMSYCYVHEKVSIIFLYMGNNIS